MLPMTLHLGHGHKGDIVVITFNVVIYSTTIRDNYIQPPSNRQIFFWSDQLVTNVLKIIFNSKF